MEGGSTMRIEKHPIIDDFQKGEKIAFYYNGQLLYGMEGEPIAIALKNNGIIVTRYTNKNNEPRGMYCAIGRCTDCSMIVDGQPNVRTCVTPLKENMHVETQYGLGNKINQ